jgi:indolepyruvate ferredoxin oxidoreductase beta subunit
VIADIVLAGVGGQGVLTVAAVLAEGALIDGLDVRQSEVHGMAQRGGAVQAMVRISDAPLHAGLVARGAATLLVGLEPVEALRHIGFLAAGGRLVSAVEPLENVPEYPDPEQVLGALRRVPGAVLVEASALARDAGSPRSANVVMAGAASAFLTVEGAAFEQAIRDRFEAKGSRVVEANLAAFGAGRQAAAERASV